MSPKVAAEGLETLGPTGSGATSARCGRCGVPEGVRECPQRESSKSRYKGYLGLKNALGNEERNDCKKYNQLKNTKAK